jgi:membrane-associated phospholipid phosphatase
MLDLVNGRLIGRWDLLDDQVMLWAQYGVFLLLGVAGVRGLFELKTARRRGLLLVLAVVMAAAIAGGLVVLAGHFVTEGRPFAVDSDTIQLLPHGADNSFPSDHATLAGLVAVMASLAWARWSWLFLLLGALVGLSRVLAGLHYPGDVVAGWTIGGSSAVAAWLAVSRAGERSWLANLR